MKGILRHPLRVLFRGLWLGAELGISAFNFSWMVGFGKKSRDNNRTKWLQVSSRRMLRVFNVSLGTTGDLPSAGFLACNHLSYLDILLIAAVTPLLFVAKGGMGGWSMLRRVARPGGWLFVGCRKWRHVVQVDQENP